MSGPTWADVPALLAAVERQVVLSPDVRLRVARLSDRRPALAGVALRESLVALLATDGTGRSHPCGPDFGPA
ncbi:MAG: hypothetical protein R3F60_07250 [bacterium]